MENMNAAQRAHTALTCINVDDTTVKTAVLDARDRVESYGSSPTDTNLSRAVLAMRNLFNVLIHIEHTPDLEIARIALTTLLSYEAKDDVEQTSQRFPLPARL